MVSSPTFLRICWYDGLRTVSFRALDNLVETILVLRKNLRFHWFDMGRRQENRDFWPALAV